MSLFSVVIAAEIRDKAVWLSGVRAVPDCIAEVHGLKWAGTELPGIRVGSFHDTACVTFAVCHGHNPGIVIDLANSKYDKVVLTVENPEEIAARLKEEVRGSSPRSPGGP